MPWPWLMLALSVALGAVAVGGESRVADGMAVGAGSHAGLGGAMQRLLVIERRQRLLENLGVTRGAIAVDAFVMFLVSESHVAIRRLHQNGIRWSAGRGRRLLWIRLLWR